MRHFTFHRSAFTLIELLVDRLSCPDGCPSAVQSAGRESREVYEHPQIGLPPTTTTSTAGCRYERGPSAWVLLPNLEQRISFDVARGRHLSSPFEGLP